LRPTHVLLAILTAAIWGFNFVVIRWGLGTFPPLLLACLRFVVAALPVFFLPRPRLPWAQLILIGCLWFVGQFAFLFTGMRVGMPPGLASVVMQAQAFMTILFAAIVLHERPNARQIAGILVAACGLVTIAASVTGSADDLTVTGLCLILAGAASWALGNVSLRRAGKADMLAMVVWLSLVPPLPLFALSLLIEGPDAIVGAFATVDAVSVGSVLYLGIFATIVGFGIWGHLLKLYPAAVVSPFSLLVPPFGVISASFVFGEQFGPLRIAAMVMILAGLAITVLPGRRIGATARVPNPS
jgi:O-acetylserine/cysteine efflux transporter